MYRMPVADRGANCCCPCCDMLWTEDKLPSWIARDICRALFVDDLAVCFRGHSLNTIERHLQQAVNAIQEWATRNGFKFAAQKCKVMHFIASQSRVQRPRAIRIGNTFPPVEESTKFLGLWRDSHLSFKKHISMLKIHCREALNLIQVVAHLKWEGTETPFWCCTGPLYAPSFTTVALCMAQHRIPIYDNWTAFTTLDWYWHWERSVPAQSPACTQRLMKLPWRSVG